ncbi:septum formation initiator family protein [Alkalihalobacillus oceani]|uniref:FtsB family cell division protein n=1 Tax=Halalkalibacter oceani TaxID=1653776 RepID=UPI00203C5A3D|nr:septum formation initiator family protein [Halalkalibacter oceani]MCM3762576.1 septum formation initiator family protein [Halalkalibacter oceani]
MSANRATRVRTLDKAYTQQREQEIQLQTKKRRGLIRRLSALAILAIVVGCVGIATIYAQTSSLEEKRQEKLALEEQLQQLQAEEQRLEQEIENYNNLDYIAEVARRDYYLSKPGETLFKLPERSSD